MIGGAGNDTLFGGQQSDLMHGGRGDDWLDGGDQLDTMIGGVGDDTLFGGGGRDRIVGGTGNDLMSGGGSRDVFVLRAGHGDDTIEGWQGGADRLGLGGIAFDALHVEGRDGGTLVTYGDGDTLFIVGLDPTRFDSGDLV